MTQQIHPAHKQPLLDRRAAANYLGISPQTLAGWASTGEPLVPFFRLGRKVMYGQRDLDDFLESRRVTGPARSFQPPQS